MKLVINKKNVVFSFLLAGTVFYPILLRYSFVPSAISMLNPFFMCALVLTVIEIIQRRKRFSQMIVLSLVCIMALICVYSNYKYGFSLIYCVKVFICIVFPLMLLGWGGVNGLTYDCFLRGLKIYNVMINIIVFSGVLNVVGHQCVLKLLMKVINVADNYDRLWSIWGHPLYNTFLILNYFTINYINAKYGKPLLNNIYLIITTLMGCLLTASKTGIVIFLCTLIIFNYKSIKYTIIEFLVVIGFYLSGGFDFVLSRFAGSLTTSRVETMDMLKGQSYFKEYKFFYGYGTGYAFNEYRKYISWATAAYEFPFLSFILEYGYLFTVLFYVVTVAVPAIIIIRRKQFDLLVCLFVVVGDMNTYNGITMVCDYMTVFIFAEIVILYLSHRAWKNKKNLLVD